MAGPDEEPLGDELCELAAVMCDIDLMSIEIVGLILVLDSRQAATCVEKSADLNILRSKKLQRMNYCRKNSRSQGQS